MTRSRVSMQDIATRLGVSVKTVSGALHNPSIRMSDETRHRIRALANELGYVPNLVARGMRQGTLPIVGMVAEGVITQPFATEIVRSFDNVLRLGGLRLIVSNLRGRDDVEAEVAELKRLMPQRIVYASMYHRTVTLPASLTDTIALMVNCREASDAVPALVPAERAAGRMVTAHLLSRGRRRIAFLNLPGLVAASLRESGFRDAHGEAGLQPNETWLRPATAELYSDRAPSLVGSHIADWFAGAGERPDAILCGNDRVALETYNALRRAGLDVPGDVAVASFDNQVEIAARLDPPLTTMALPHREMGRLAGEMLSGQRALPATVEEVPFRLVERASV
ncbi:LacI family transcriptional regulator [Aureimonas ureilytica]|uniref:LacI family transcriptional regulator n=1 Tax=Aureimonas ureilytica TaxID=401562 RepID=A0A175RW06_9HYPH|nr:LacI family DNA-binding transcriptional regulator [Aureimonas ureilytica]KTR07583.1 LacI family transcriptional regulator [Aureimonas ureilytica]